MNAVGKVAAARKLASAAAFGGGGLSVLGASLYGVLVAEARLARRTIGEPLADPVRPASGWYGRRHRHGGTPLRLALLGDSGACGYGVEKVEQTPGAHLASGLADASGRPVYLHAVPVVGARTVNLAAQIDTVLAEGTPDVAVILVGANDVTHRVRPSESVRLLEEGVRRLTDVGVAVVVGTCPDLGTVEPIPPPLRQVARAWSRRLAAAQSIAVVEAGGRSVSVGSILGPEFAASPSLLFGPDRFHPSAAGYASLASVLLPSLLAAAGVLPPEEEEPEPFRGEGVLPITDAAVEAVRTPGTELDATELSGTQRGARGRWVLLRHRRRLPEPEPEAPEPTGPEATAVFDGSAGPLG